MQHMYIDFGRMLTPANPQTRVEVGFADAWQLAGKDLQPGERILVHDDALAVEGILQSEYQDGKVYWFVVPDWSTRQDDDAEQYWARQALG